MGLRAQVVDLVGLQLVDEAHEPRGLGEVGVVQDVEGTLHDSRLVVRSADGEILVPLAGAICTTIDVAAKQIVIVSGQRIEAVVPDDAQSSAITIELRPSRRQRQQALERQRQAAGAAEIDEEEEDEDESFETIVVYSGTGGDDDEIEEIDE